MLLALLATFALGIFSRLLVGHCPGPQPTVAGLLECPQHLLEVLQEILGRVYIHFAGLPYVVHSHCKSGLEALRPVPPLLVSRWRDQLVLGELLAERLLDRRDLGPSSFLPFSRYYAFPTYLIQCVTIITLEILFPSTFFRESPC